MCGFLGIISDEKINNEYVKNADEYLHCRGPDSHKFHNFKLGEKNVVLSFHRLSVIDLSNLADQPMESKLHNTEIVFNGEIYNHKVLRKEMQNSGIEFKTSHSDTETLLIGFSYWV